MTVGMSSSLLTTKLYIPPLHLNLVSRPRLIKRLDEGLCLGRRVTVISAPAGFGKTTLVTSLVTLLINDVAATAPTLVSELTPQSGSHAGGSQAAGRNGGVDVKPARTMHVYKMSYP
jgi:hypothetical protein